MARWIVFHMDEKQSPNVPGLGTLMVTPDNVDYDPDDPWANRTWEAETAGAAISQAALTLREGGDFFATNIDTLVEARNVELQMQAVVPGIRSAGAKRND